MLTLGGYRGLILPHFSGGHGDIAFVPFPSAVLSANAGRPAAIFYAATMSVAGLLSALLWWYASRGGAFTVPQLTPRERRREFIAPLGTTLVFLLSIGIAFADAGLAILSWLLILPAALYLQRR